MVGVQSRAMRVLSVAMTAVLYGCASPADLPLVCPDGAATCVDLRIVAHEDDDLLFINPDVEASIANGNEVTTVYLTAGTMDDPARLSAREAGILNAYSYMVDPELAVTEAADEPTMLAHWSLHDGAPVELMTSEGPRHVVQYDFVSPTAEHGRLSVVFLRLVVMELGALWDEPDVPIASIACSTGCILGSASAEESYDKATLLEVLGSLMERFEEPGKPFAVSTLDATGLFELGNGYGETWVDNSDHVAAAMFAVSAFVKHEAAGDANASSLVQYRGYDIGEEDPNLGDEMLEKRRAFYRYYVIGEQAADTNENADDPRFRNPLYNDWTARAYALPSDAPRTAQLEVGHDCLVTSGGIVSMGDCSDAPTWRATDRFQLQASSDPSQCIELDHAGAAVMRACSPGAERQTFVFTSTGQVRTDGALCLDGDGSGVRALPCDKQLDSDGNPSGEPITAQAWRWAD